MKIEIELPTFSHLPADQQIQICQLIEGSIKAIAAEFCQPCRVRGEGDDTKISWVFERADDVG